MNDELEWVWKKGDHGLMEVYPLHLPGETEENHENPSVRLAGVSAKIRNEHVLNMSLERHL
jgi:hypothetical protein